MLILSLGFAAILGIDPGSMFLTLSARSPQQNAYSFTLLDGSTQRPRSGMVTPVHRPTSGKSSDADKFYRELSGTDIRIAERVPEPYEDEEMNGGSQSQSGDRSRASSAQVTFTEDRGESEVKRSRQDQGNRSATLMVTMEMWNIINDIQVHITTMVYSVGANCIREN